MSVKGAKRPHLLAGGRPGRDRFSVDGERALGDAVPGELRLDAPAARLAHAPRAAGIAQRARTAAASAAGSPGGTSTPVSPSTTTSGMPPTRLATTGVPQAIASRLMSPNGSYTEGQTKTAAWL